MAPLIVLLLMSVIGIPLALLLNLLPGVWIYLTIALSIYALLRLVWREASPLWMVMFAVIPSLAMGFFVPLLANKATEKRVTALLAQDHGEPPILPRGLSIVLAIDRGLGSPNKCWDTCQRLLFSQTASSFVEVPLDQLPMLASLPSRARRFSLGPIGKECNNTRLVASYASEEEVGNMHPPPRLWDKLPELAQQGLCVHDNEVRDVRSDVLVIDQKNYDPAFRAFRFDGPGWRLSFNPIEPFERREVFRRTQKGWTRLMRRTEVRYAQLSTPLWLVPGFTFDTSTPTHWKWQNHRAVGRPIEIYIPTTWSGILANDLSIRGLR